MADSRKDRPKDRPPELATVLELGLRADEPWRPEELQALLEHEFSSPLEFDLGNLEEGHASRLKRLSEAEGLVLRSLRELLFHSRPPIDLLRLVKDFAKRCAAHPRSALPPEVASVIYYASIAAALVRCAVRITELDDAALRHGFEWVLAQPWVDQSTKQVVARAVELVQDK
jgi:hypothetical protein